MRTLGTVEKVFYENLKTSNKSSAFLIDSPIHGHMKVLAHGIDSPIQIGKNYFIEGDVETTEKYGSQLVANNIFILKTRNTSIHDFLTSSILESLSPADGDSLYNTYGSSSMDVLRNLELLRGIPTNSTLSMEQLSTIHNELNQADGNGVVSNFFHLASLGLTGKQSLNAIDAFKDNTLQVAITSPYLLMSVPGIGFTSADKVALKVGTKPENSTRINHGIDQAFEDLRMIQPNTPPLIGKFVEKLMHDLDIQRSFAEFALAKRIENNHYKVVDDRLVNTKEFEISERIRERLLSQTGSATDSNHSTNSLAPVTNFRTILSQPIARIRYANDMDRNEILDSASALAKENSERILYIPLDGKTKLPSSIDSSVHRIIFDGDRIPSKSEFLSLLNTINSKTQITLLSGSGDDTFGLGNQAPQFTVANNHHASTFLDSISNSSAPGFVSSETVKFVNSQNQNLIKNIIGEIESLSINHNISPKDIHVIAASSVTSVGSAALNRELQNHFGSKQLGSITLFGQQFHPGDKIFTVNQISHDIDAHQHGKIFFIDKPQQEIWTKFNDKLHILPFSDFSNVKLGYATNIKTTKNAHFEAVVAPVSSENRHLLSKDSISDLTLLSKSRISFVGDQEIFNTIISQNSHPSPLSIPTKGNTDDTRSRQHKIQIPEGRIESWYLPKDKEELLGAKSGWYADLILPKQWPHPLLLVPQNSSAAAIENGIKALNESPSALNAKPLSPRELSELEQAEQHGRKHLVNSSVSSFSLIIAVGLVFQNNNTERYAPASKLRTSNTEAEFEI